MDTAQPEHEPMTLGTHDSAAERRRNTSRKSGKVCQRWLPFKAALKTMPILGRTAAVPKRYVNWLRWRVGVAVRRARLGFSPDQTYWVDPKEIVYCTRLEWNPFWHEGEVRGGDWDRTDVRFEDLDIYQATRQRYLEKRDWSETEFYRRCSARIEAGEALWGCASRKDFDARCSELDNLFETTRASGYKSQRELNAGGPRMSLKNVDEVSVNVARDGTLLFNNSAHRLSIVKLLEIAEIPVRVIVRHEESIGRFALTTPPTDEVIRGRRQQKRPTEKVRDASPNRPRHGGSKAWDGEERCR